MVSFLWRTQAESGWLGVISIVASCLLALAVARLTDILTGRMKLTITVLLSLSAVAFAVLTLMCLGLVETSTPSKPLEIETPFP